MLLYFLRELTDVRPAHWAAASHAQSAHWPIATDLPPVCLSVCLSVCWSQPRAVLEWLKQSRCRLCCGLAWTQGQSKQPVSTLHVVIINNRTDTRKAARQAQRFLIRWGIRIHPGELGAFLGGHAPAHLEVWRISGVSRSYSLGGSSDAPVALSASSACQD